ncbi:MAG TPA: lipocalin-like domain-containing protein [Chthoniobacteraceae bacterium]|jgi:predicted secreted hydrolase
MAPGEHLQTGLSLLLSAGLIFAGHLPASGAPEPAPPESSWRLALPGWRYAFPRDHFPHPEFKTEWWYFTGNLRDENGRRFGYQATFFRQGMRTPAQRGGERSRFIVNDLKFAHFAFTEVAAKRFRFEQKISRGAFGEAGFAAANGTTGDQRLAWIDDWQLTLREGDQFSLKAKAKGVELQLELSPGKPWVAHGTNGVSQKAEGIGRASHYYSGTRMPTTGQVKLDGRAIEVRGESWFDHEWGSNQLAENQVGWDWFSIQLEDGSELMLYQMRLRDGTLDPASSGSFISAEGKVHALLRDDYRLTPKSFWKSPASGGKYPVRWEVVVPSLDLRLEVSTPVSEQELALTPIAYWEGLIDVAGTRAGRPVRGHGYLELTGYAGSLPGLSAKPNRAGSE